MSAFPAEKFRRSKRTPSIVNGDQLKQMGPISTKWRYIVSLLNAANIDRLGTVCCVRAGLTWNASSVSLWADWPKIPSFRS